MTFQSFIRQDFTDLASKISIYYEFISTYFHHYDQNPITIEPEDTLQTAQEIFDKYHIHHIPCSLRGRIEGMLSKSDFSFFQERI